MGLSSHPGLRRDFSLNTIKYRHAHTGKLRTVRITQIADDRRTLPKRPYAREADALMRKAGFYRANGKRMM